MRPALAICIFLTLGAPFGTAVDLSRGEDRLGLPAPRLGLERWLNSPPLEMDRLRGNVVLIRWWTDGCPYCAATAPALKQMARKYGARGLQIIGIFHPKPPGDWSVERMRAATQEKSFTFPVALDGGWTALDRWWPDLEKHGWTSVSFVVDKKGIIRYVHPGGEFHEATETDHARCDRDYKDVEQIIERLLKQ